MTRQAAYILKNAGLNHYQALNWLRKRGLLKGARK